jgi:hypothetical protein
MDPVLAYVREEATDDVRDTLTWLDHMGFQLAYSTGGPREGFGDALLLFTGAASSRGRPPGSRASTRGYTPAAAVAPAIIARWAAAFGFATFTG